MSVNIHFGLTDHLPPELKAMTMARYSRDVGSVMNRLPTEEQIADSSKTKDNMQKYYIGYGHKSVGQLAGTDVFFEGVSQIAAKAIENHPLYNGQESSTRYIDFANQPFVKVVDNSEADEWQEIFRAFYLKALDATIIHLNELFPYDDNKAASEVVYNNTIKARAFDICRGFLPAGITTNVAFSATFDTINDHFGEMLKHPLSELSSLAIDTIDGMSVKYLYGIKPLSELNKRFSYVTENHFYTSPPCYDQPTVSGFDHGTHTTNVTTLDIKHLLSKRNKWDNLPRSMSGNFTIYLMGKLDFGSFRDLHRHRNGYLHMPVLVPKHGFEKYYIHNLPDAIAKEGVDLLLKFEDWYFNQTTTSGCNNTFIELQYVVPMGYNVPVQYNCDINQALYIFELRSGKTVHQTLRTLVNEWVVGFREVMRGAVIYNDTDEDNFTLKRGTQTFDVK